MIKGRNTKFGHGTFAAPTVITDYTTDIRELTVTESGTTIDSTTFASVYRTAESGFKDFKFNVTYKYTDDLYIEIAKLWDASTDIAFEYAPNGDGAGKPSVTGTMTMTSFNESSGREALMEINVEYSLQESLTRGVFI
ncbi:MAG: hypothetical protein ACR2MD_01040 [Aridibacter sp.]